MKLALGIDIGGTNTAFGFVDKEGNCIAESKIPTQTRENVEDYVADLAMAIKTTFEDIKDEHELIGIGIGAPNANYLTGTIDSAANLPWKGTIHLIDMLKEYFDLPIFINNDANAAALGEMVYGNAKGMNNFITITLGTGLGSGIVIDGEMVYGHDGIAGEFGHVIVTPNGRQCGCGRRGCLETYVSATGVKRTAYKMLALYNHESKLRDIPFNELNAKIVHNEALAGDEIALETFRYTGEQLGHALSNIVVITNPEAIFLLGGLAKAGDYIFKPTRDAMEENLMAVFKGKVKLLPSGIDTNAAILGASAMAW